MNEYIYMFFLAYNGKGVYSYIVYNIYVKLLVGGCKHETGKTQRSQENKGETEKDRK